MKLEYKKEEEGQVVAAIYNVNDNSSIQCLCMKTKNSNKFIWIYPDTKEITVQSEGFSDSKPVKEFREGDSITITF